VTTTRRQIEIAPTAGACGDHECCKRTGFDRLEDRLLAFMRGEKEKQANP